MSIEKMVNIFRSEPTISENVTFSLEIQPRKSETSPLPEFLHPDIVQALKDHNINELYSHQAKALQYINEKKNIIIVTGTSSGKTLCYNLPILDRIIRDSRTRALYLFPTKALTQDQYISLQTFIDKIHQNRQKPHSHEYIKIGVYDGDTPYAHRKEIRDRSNIIFSNPDMLHMGILPHHTDWGSFFTNIAFVVIDEIHTYRGVFGSHLANLLRRFKRISKFYNSSPIFILTSATIANSLDFSKRLIEDEIYEIREDGSPRGKKFFYIYNPPIIDKELGLRKSAYHESTQIIKKMVESQINSIIFTRSRPSVEFLLSQLKTHFSLELIDNPNMIRGYRSGYLPKQRREIEKNLRKGTTKVVVATNALELGIDIGNIKASITIGYPGSISSIRQQAGRAGRGVESSISIFIATQDPLDQFLSRHPEFLIDRSPEAAHINPDNLLILYDHIRCSAFELPFNEGDRFGNVPSEKINEILQFLTEQKYLYYSNQKYYWMADKYPAQMVSLRNSSPVTISLQVEESLDEPTNPRIIGLVDYESSLWMVHPEAIYLHEAETYLVNELDLTNKIAHLQPVRYDYYTEPIREVHIRILEVLEKNIGKYIDTGYGEIEVTSQVIGYRKIHWLTNQRLGSYELQLPSTELITTGYWIILNNDLVVDLKNKGLWNNDPNDYGANWQKIREIVRKRDNYTCQVCGAKEIGKAHDIHHKIPFRQFQSVEQANVLDNLVTLCHPCHQKVESNLRIRSGLAGFAYVISNLVPLHLMCDFRDIGVHFDPQSNLAEGKPILILYDDFPAGLGLTENLIGLQNIIFHQARELISTCNCSDGCPSCTGPGGENGTGGKQETLAILDTILENELSIG